MAVAISCCTAFSQNSAIIDNLLSQLRGANDDSTRLEIYLKLSDSYKQLNPQSALDYAQRALTLAEEKQDTLNIILANRKIGGIYSYISSYDLALEQQFTALGLAERWGNKLAIGNTYNAIGGVYYDMAEYDNAFVYFQQALTLRKEAGDEGILASSYNNVGEIYRLKGDYKLAEEYYWRASELNDRLRQNAASKELRDKHKAWLAINYNNLGLVYAAMNEPIKAERFLLASVQLYEGDVNANVGALASSLVSLANFYLESGDYQQALDVFLRAYLAADQVGDLLQLKFAAEGLSNAYREMGDFERALQYNEIYTQLKDSIFNEEKHRQVIIVQSYFETEREKEENEKLTYKNQVQQLEIDRRRRERYYFIAGGILLLILILVVYGRYRIGVKVAEQLRKNVDEKEILIQEIHHRVKNNLQMISSLLNLQSAKITDAIVLEALDDSKSRVNSMALVHQKLYQAEDFSNIDFQDYIEQLVQTVTMGYDIEGKITSEVNAQGFRFGINTAIPLGLIINELLTNSYKHGFAGKEAGIITVEITKLDEAFKLIIADNGVGLPPDFSFENTDSLGLELVEALTEQLDGTISFSSNEGARFEITFAAVD